MSVQPPQLDAAARARIVAAGEGWLRRAEAVLGDRLPAPDWLFDLRGRALGQFMLRGGRPCIRFNAALFAQRFERALAEVVPHEVAHYVVWRRHGWAVKPHGREWRAWMAVFGVPARARCPDLGLPDPAVRRERRWPYRCACREHDLSTRAHRAAQAGRRRYFCRACGGALEPVGAT